MNTDTHVLTLTWSAPLDAGSSPITGYLVQRNGLTVYTGTALSFAEEVHDSAVYTISAESAAGAGAPATFFYSQVYSGALTTYPWCLDIIHLDPLPVVNYSCIFPLPQSIPP